MRIGVLTGGGDCHGLNAVIGAVVRKGIDGYGNAFVGFRDGWRGVLETDYIELTTRVGARAAEDRRGGADRLGATDQTFGFDTALQIATEDAANERRWGTMPALRGTRIEIVPLADAVAQLRTVP